VPLIAACQRISAAPFDAEVIVIGAGLAGLYTAYLLASEGVDALVLEASDRIGGRLYTIEHGAGIRTEAGGEEVGAGYARMRAVAGALGVDIAPGSGSRPSMALHYKGRLIPAEDWETASVNPMPERYKATTPGALLGRLAFGQNPLKAADDWRNVSQADISAYDWLKQQGLPEAVISDVNLTLNGTDVRSYSMANLFRSLVLFQQDRQFGASGSIAGGSQRLPEAMARALPRAVQTGQSVRSIHGQDDAVIVETAKRRFKARCCVAAVPFPVLRSMDVDAPLSQRQRKAIAQLPYTAIVQLHFKAAQPYWESDSLPASMWSDGPLERVFASQDAGGAPNGWMRAWINGARAAALGARSNGELEALCRAEMLRLRPASKGAIEDFKVIRWTQDNPLAGGAYMHWAPGQIARWAGRMGARAGQLYFAGEHLSYLHTGMEGAMESAEQTAFAILNA
jgi:monoamine oxidase